MAPFNLALGCFALALFTAIAASLRISLLQPPRGSLVVGTPRVWRGHTACLRATAGEAALGDDASPVLLLPRMVSFTLRDERGARGTALSTPASTGPGADPWVEVNLAIPADLAVDAWLDVAVTTEDGVDLITIPVHGVDTPGEMRGQIAPWHKVLAASAAPQVLRGPVQLALYPVSGELVGGLANLIIGRITQRDLPWPTSVAGPSVEAQTRSDAYGLFRFTYRPPPQAGPLFFDLGDAPQLRLALPLVAQARQLRLDATPNVRVSTATGLHAQIDTLPFRDPVQVDVWVGDILLWGKSAAPKRGEHTMELPVPANYTGFMLVMAARNPLRPQDTSSTALRWVGDDLAAATAALTAFEGDDPVKAALRRAPPDEQAVLLPLALSRFVPENLGAPLLANSVQGRRAAFEANRDADRQHLHGFIAAVAALGGFLAIGWVAQHQRRLRRAVGDAIHDVPGDGEADDEMAAPELARRISRPSHPVNLFFAVLALLLAGYGLFTLIAQMRWR